MRVGQTCRSSMASLAGSMLITEVFTELPIVGLSTIAESMVDPETANNAHANCQPRTCKERTYHRATTKEVPNLNQPEGAWHVCLSASAVFDDNIGAVRTGQCRRWMAHEVTPEQSTQQERSERVDIHQIEDCWLVRSAGVGCGSAVGPP